MQWIKVTPETMPPDMKPVMCSVKWNIDNGEIESRGDRQVYSWVFRYNPNIGWEYFSYEGWMWEEVFYDGDDSKWFAITHWTPWPEPAED